MAALQAELAWQRGTPLVFENLDRLYPDMRDEVLGNRILRLIELTDACHPCKVTGMILEGCSTRELFDMLHEDEEAGARAILALVCEAHEVLQMSAEWREYVEPKGEDEASVCDEAGSESWDLASRGSDFDERASAAPTELSPRERSASDQSTSGMDEWQLVKTKRRRSPSSP